MTQWLSSLQQFSVVCKFHCSHQTMLQYLSRQRRKSFTHRSHHLLVSPHPRLPIPSPSFSHRYPFTISNHSPKACEKLVFLSNCLSLSPQRSPRFQPETVKPAIDALYRAQLRAILRGGRAETDGGSGPLAMSASRTAIFLKFAILVVEVWRNGKTDRVAMPADLGRIVCASWGARAHSIPEFHPTSTRQPRRRGPASKIRDRFPKERFPKSIFGSRTRRFSCKACAK